MRKNTYIPFEYFTFTTLRANTVKCIRIPFLLPLFVFEEGNAKKRLREKIHIYLPIFHIYRSQCKHCNASWSYFLFFIFVLEGGNAKKRFSPCTFLRRNLFIGVFHKKFLNKEKQNQNKIMIILMIIIIIMKKEVGLLQVPKQNQRAAIFQQEKDNFINDKQQHCG